jgi:hypothetical protein
MNGMRYGDKPTFREFAFTGTNIRDCKSSTKRSESTAGISYNYYDTTSRDVAD